jgi:hypothetical protein
MKMEAGTQLPPALADADTRRQQIQEAMGRIKELERQQKEKEQTRAQEPS